MVLRPRGRGRVGRRRHPFAKPPLDFQRGLRASITPRPPACGSLLIFPPMRAGIVTVVGKPNAGKSTLLNRIVGQKLSITSPKPQSTRDRIVGIRTTDATQMVLLDTPGLLEPRYALQQVMRSTALTALDDAD